MAQQLQTRPKVKEEGTFTRDMALLERHRDWGWDCPAEDIDFIEYNHRHPVALVEYKKRHSLKAVTPTLDANLETLASLGNLARLPVFATFYTPDLHWYRCFGVNWFGKAIQSDSNIINEYHYVRFLYTIRRMPMPTGFDKPLYDEVT